MIKKILKGFNKNSRKYNLRLNAGRIQNPGVGSTIKWVLLNKIQKATETK